MPSNFEFTAIKKDGVATMQVDGSRNFVLSFLKDVCIYLRRLKRDELSFQEEPNGFFTVKWGFDINDENYTVKLNILEYNYEYVPFEKFMSVLLDFCDNFELYFQYIRPSLSPISYKRYFVDVTKALTEKNYKQLPKITKHNEFNYMLNELVQNFVPDATVTIQSSGFSFDEIKAAFDLPVKQLRLYNSSKKPLIDFINLTFNGNLRYDYI